MGSIMVTQKELLNDVLLQSLYMEQGRLINDTKLCILWAVHPHLLVICIFGATAAVLFTKKFIDGLGFSRAWWTLMTFGNDALYSRGSDSGGTLLIFTHMIVNSVGLVCWIAFYVTEYKRENTWPPSELLFETGLWLVTVLLSVRKYFSQATYPEKELAGAYYWFSIAAAFGFMIANYWTNIRKNSADRLKSQLIGKAENAFDELIRTSMKEPQKDNVTKFDQTLTDFIRMLCILVAQKQETLEIAKQQEARYVAAECGNIACQSPEALIVSGFRKPARCN
uniref:Uncharacterized protein n=1 Tax=Ipomoea trifida TaxID=35884 RepID=A0A908_IPOTF|nr:hypothetical protein [Ipomoea trifida]